MLRSSLSSVLASVLLLACSPLDQPQQTKPKPSDQLNPDDLIFVLAPSEPETGVPRVFVRAHIPESHVLAASTVSSRASTARLVTSSQISVNVDPSDISFEP